MDKIKFVQGLKALAANFNLEIQEGYIELLFGKLSENGFSDNDFSRAVNNILDKESQLFKMPSIASFLDYAGKKALEIDDIATLEVSNILRFTPYYGGDVIFDNPTTNACLESFGGVNELAKAREKGNRSFLVKELKELWLACYNSDKKKFTPCEGDSQPMIYRHIKGVFSISPEGYKMEGVFEKRQNSLEYVGDKNKCLQLMEQKESVRLIPNFKKA